MKFLMLLNLGLIRKKLNVLVMLAGFPALVLLYSGMEQRRNTIEDAKQDVLHKKPQLRINPLVVSAFADGETHHPRLLCEYTTNIPTGGTLIN